MWNLRDIHSLSQKFEDQVRRSPDGIAVCSDNFYFSYHELNQLANRVANVILKLEKITDRPIALFLDHDAEMIYCLLGILKAGRICVPVNNRTPLTRLVKILNSAGASLLITASKRTDELRSIVDNTIKILSVDETKHKLNCLNPEIEVYPESPAVILYTSGSGGQPKGVLQNYINLLREYRRVSDSLAISTKDRLSFLLSPSVSGGIREIFLALLNGATLLPYDFPRRGPDRFADWLNRHRLTVLRLVPSLLRNICESFDNNNFFSTVRLIYIGGEVAFGRDVGLIRRYFDVDCGIVNVYGSTETGLTMTHFIGSEIAEETQAVPVGKANRDIQVILSDEHGSTAVSGAVGQILIKSPYLATGYWNSPGQTALAFRPDSQNAVNRSYLTGDLGRELPSGAIAYLGRIDDQIQIHGNRVELGEIEAVLDGHSAVLKSVVTISQQTRGKTPLLSHQIDHAASLSAYVVPARSRQIDIRDVRSYLAERLPVFMIPAKFVIIEKLPLTPSGKIDRRALPVPAALNDVQASTCEFPQNPTEAKIVKIWTELFGLDQVSVTDDFFELGGDSILAIRLFGQLEQIFKCTMPVSSLYPAPTIRELSTALLVQSRPASVKSLTVVRPTGHKPPLFCIHGGGGEVLMYHDLAGYVGIDRPLFALRQKGGDGLPLDTTSIEKMATEYLQEIRNIQSEGPYYLVGYCFGGLIAYEMAQQLRCEKRDVGILILIESRNPGHRLTEKGNLMLRGLGRQYNRLMEIPIGGRSRYFFNEAKRLATLNMKKTRDHFCNNYRRLRIMFCHARGRRLPYDLRGRNLLEANREIAQRYIAKPYDGRLILFDAEESPFKPMKTWANLVAGGITLETISGDHGTIVKEPNVQVLGERIKFHLENV